MCAHDISIIWLIIHHVYITSITVLLPNTLICSMSKWIPSFQNQLKGLHHLKHPLPKQRVPVDSPWLIYLTDLSPWQRRTDLLVMFFFLSLNFISSERIITILPMGMHSEWPHTLDWSGNDWLSIVFPMLFLWAPISLQMVTAAMKLKDAFSLEEKLWQT